MPQLNPEFFLSQVFWLVITFSFLLFFLWKVSLPRISKILEKRENKINNDIQEAKKIQTEAQDIQNQIDLQLKKVHEKSSEMMKKAIIDLQKKASAELHNLDKELTKKIDESSMLIEKSKERSLVETFYNQNLS